jgi:hypothetical protein
MGWSDAEQCCENGLLGGQVCYVHLKIFSIFLHCVANSALILMKKRIRQLQTCAFGI